MTAAPCIDPSLPARRLSLGECRDCLLRRHEGRLAYSTGRGPRSVVINYAVQDHEIVLRVPEFNEICQYAPGCEVCLVIDEMLGADGEWVEVTASGVASVVDHCEHTSSRTRRPGRGLAVWSDRLDSSRPDRRAARRRPGISRLAPRPAYLEQHRHMECTCGKVLPSGTARPETVEP